MTSVFKTAYPYLDDAMNLPVENLEAAIPFYETIMGFRVVSRKDGPFKSAVLGRDGIQIGLAENGGDPTQEGCFFEVDSAEAAFDELKSNGLTTHPAGPGGSRRRKEKRPASASTNTEQLLSKCFL